MATAASTRDALDSVNLGDAASEQSALLGLLISLGDTFTSASATLSGLAAPSFTGDTWPATVRGSVASTARLLTAAATALAAADPNNTGAQATASATLIANTDHAQQLVTSIADLNLSDAQRGALGQLPSCRGLI